MGIFVTKAQFVIHLKTHIFPACSFNEFERIFALIDNAKVGIPYINGLFYIKQIGHLLPLNVEGNHIIIDVDEAIVLQSNTIERIFGNNLSQKFGDFLIIPSKTNLRIDYDTIFKFENLLIEVFKYFYVNEVKWIVQKKRKNDFLDLPFKDLIETDFCYKILKFEDGEKEDCYHYYIITLNQYGFLEIDCENHHGGMGQPYFYERLIKVHLSNIFRARSSESESLILFFQFIIINFKPSFFTLT